MSGFFDLLAQHINDTSGSDGQIKTEGALGGEVLSPEIAEQSGFVGNQSGPTAPLAPTNQQAAQPAPMNPIAQGLSNAGNQLGGFAPQAVSQQGPSPFLQAMMGTRQQQLSTNINNALTAKFGRGF